MARLSTVTPEQATGKAKDILDDVRQSFGSVPNIFTGLANSPAALGALVCMEQALSGGALSEAERQAVYLAVSQANGCQYCLAAHTMLAKKAGLSEEETLAVRRSQPGEDKHRSLVKFALAVLDKKGVVSDEDLSDFRSAGYGDAHAAEVVATIAECTFTNFFNHVHQTELDFPPAPAL